MGSTHSAAPTPQQAIIEDSAEEFLTVSSGEGSFRLPSRRRRGTGASPTPITATPKMENTPAAQATMTVPPRMARAMARSLPPFYMKSCLSQGAAGASTPLSKGQHNDEASSPASKPLPRFNRKRCRGRGHAQGGEDLDGALCPHSSSGQGGGSTYQP
jgi:hypothetical protein